MVFFIFILLLLLHRWWFSNYFVCSPPGKWSFFGFNEHIFETGGEKPPPAVYPIHAISPCIHPVSNLSSSLKLRSCPNTSGNLSSLDLRNLSWVFYPLNPFDVVGGMNFTLENPAQQVPGDCVFFFKQTLRQRKSTTELFP